MSIKVKVSAWLLGLSTLLGAFTEARAQVSDERSPYSRYGYGALQGGGTAGNRALGGLSIGLRDALITNPGNPASYTSVDSLTFIFDLGVSARYAFLQEGSNSDSRLLGNLDYISMLFPLGKRMAMSAGIMPLATTGYSFGSRAAMGGDANSDYFVRSYSGHGSYNQLYLGVAGRTFGGLHLGVNAGFVFGHSKQERQVTYTTVGALNRVNTSNLHLRGFKFDLGAQYELKLDSLGKRSLVFGATYTPGYRYKSELTAGSYESESGSSALKELTSEQVTDGRYTMPDQFGLGLSYRKAGHYMYGLDVRYSTWEQAEFPQLEAEFRNQWRVALGGEWTPNERARSPWKRAKYRAGLSAGNSYLQVPVASAGRMIGYQEYGASVGFALPLVDRRSALNFSIDYKVLHPESGGMVREHYIGATLGITFNESWFRKARVN
ncbi:MAG: hypothetical protein SPK09_07180 [Porphyromonas sp.]|nr:hypothetical protein [Porphyromonas sp.]